MFLGRPKTYWILLAALFLVLVPWLGLTLFNTKGEPREAIVALSMLKSGNWILPVSYGADIPYKPPFLAWLIALCSLALNGGAVSEFTSRLPSALAAIGMVMAGWQWCRRYGPLNNSTTQQLNNFPTLMAVITITSFEVYRAAVACRVDMVLTACMVVALYNMYAWRQERGVQPLRLLWIALLLSGAVLTKGPVGALLPCLCMGIYCLLRGDNFFKTVGWLSAVCVASFALPAVWYWKAYQIGGQHFLDLAWEENIGRLTGTMGYASHLNPWYYNVVTILGGMMPWTLVALAIGVIWYRRAKSDRSNASPSGRAFVSVLREKAFGAVRALRTMHPASLFALVISVTVFVFYCLPASKRSVYLLPMYPFMAYGVAMAVKKSAITWAPRLGAWLLLAYACVGAIIMPLALNSRSDKHAIPALNQAAAQALAKLSSPASPDNSSVFERLPLYSYIPGDSLMRYYTLNFYLGDVIRVYNPSSPPPAPFLLLAPPDAAIPLPANYTPQASPAVFTSCDTRRHALIHIYK